MGIEKEIHMETTVDQGADTVLLEAPKKKYEKPTLVKINGAGSKMAYCSSGNTVTPDPPGNCQNGNSPNEEE